MNIILAIVYSIRRDKMEKEYIKESTIKEKSDKENADFRVVKCNYCGKNYLLPKRDNLYWDAVIENHAITVLPKAKQKAKKPYITRQQMYKQ